MFEKKVVYCKDVDDAACLAYVFILFDCLPDDCILFLFNLAFAWVSIICSFELVWNQNQLKFPIPNSPLYSPGLCGG